MSGREADRELREGIPPESIMIFGDWKDYCISASKGEGPPTNRRSIM